MFAAALFLAAAFFVTYAEPNESDAAVTGTGTFDDPWYCGPDGSSSVTATLINGVLTISSSGAMDNYTHTSGVVNTPWWNEKESIVSAVIEEGVTSIGIRAFYNCTNLTSINIPDSVTEIGDAAFYLCIKLTSINIPDGVTQIGDTAFYLCSRLTSVVMPDSMISIGASAFQACASLESVVIDSVTSIGNYAFQGCTKLESVEILGNMLTSIGDNAFNGCSNLTFVAMSGNLKTIGSSAFNGCSNLTFVAMSGNLKTIGSRAFNGCSNLTSIVIPDGVETIGDRAFYNCTKLESVEILGNTLKTIGDNAFQGCTKLISIIIPDKVTSIGGYAFYKCTSLESIVIPGSVKTIGTTVFFECTSLTSVVIPDSVTTIGTQAFQNCTALTTVTVTGGSGGNITADGIIDKYFKNGKGWKLPGANYAAKYLILPDISSGDYASTNIAAYAGRELHYSDKVYTASGSSWTESTSLYTVSGTVKDSDSAGIEGAKVSLGTNGVYTALTDADGKYTIANVPADTYNITVTKAGYVTGTISSVTVSSSDVTGKDISLNVSKYTVSGTVTAGGNSVPSNVTVSYTSDNSSFSSGNVTTDGSGKYTISDIPHGTSLSITVADGAVTGYHGATILILSLDAGIPNMNIVLEINRYEISGTVKDTEGKTVAGAVIRLEYSSAVYAALSKADGTYVLKYIPHFASGNITVSKTGYEQEGTVSVTSLDKNLSSSDSKDLTLKINEYKVSLAWGTGSGGFRYSVNGGTSVPYAPPLFVKHGETIVITAVPSEEYAFVSWSGNQSSAYSDFRINPLTVSDVSGPIDLTASGELIEYYVTFDSGSNYTVYANGSSASSAVGVTGGGSLSFSVRTAEGYSAVPVINGIAYLTAQGDGSYVIENIHSNLNVTVTVSPYSISDPDGNGSGNSSGNGEGSGDGNNSAGDSADSGIPLWIPVILAGAFLACIAAAAAGNIIIKRRKDDGENSS